MDGLTRLLVAQDLVVSRRQALEHVTPGALRHRLASGRWQVVVPGVLLAASGTPTERQRLRAALVHGGPDSVLAGATACRLHGLGAGPGPVVVAVPRASRVASTAGVSVLRTTRSSPAQRMTGLPVHCAGRAVVDACLSLVDDRAVRALVAESVQRRRTTVGELQRELARAPRRGSGALRAALADVAGGARSLPEGVLLRELRRTRGLPAWEMDADVLAEDGRWLARADLVVRSVRVLLEVDGVRWHLSPERWAADLERHTRLEVAGWTVLRYPAARVLSDTAGVVEELRRVCLRRLAA